MDKKTTGIVSYITLIGWLIAFCAGDKEGAKFHLNQSLVLYLASLINSIIISRIPICGWAVSGILSIVFFIFCGRCSKGRSRQNIFNWHI